MSDKAKDTIHLLVTILGLLEALKRDVGGLVIHTCVPGGVQVSTIADTYGLDYIISRIKSKLTEKLTD